MPAAKNSYRPDFFLYDLVKLQEQLYHYALQLTEDQDDAMDLVQETSFKALRNQRRLHDNEHIRAWLYTILKNTYINFLRSGHNKQLVHDTEKVMTHPEPSKDQRPDEVLLLNELKEIIARLPADYKTPIRLFLSGYSYQEIAKQMDLPLGTIKSRIHLGKKKIRHIYSA